MVEEKFEEIVKKIESMSVLELSKFVKVLEERFGIQTSLPQLFPSQVLQASGAPAESKTEEKSVFNVILTDAGSNKVQVIKLIKECTGKGLKESKDLTENLPSTIKEGVKKEEAEEIKKKLEEIGARVELK